MHAARVDALETHYKIGSLRHAFVHTGNERRQPQEAVAVNARFVAGGACTGTMLIICIQKFLLGVIGVCLDAFLRLVLWNNNVERRSEKKVVE